MATITTASKEVIKIRQPCSTVGCKGTCGEMVHRSDLNDEGYVTGMKVKCSKCRKALLEGRDRKLGTPQERHSRSKKGRTVAGITSQVTPEMMGCRILSKAEIDELSKTLKPPAFKKPELQPMWDE